MPPAFNNCNCHKCLSNSFTSAAVIISLSNLCSH